VEDALILEVGLSLDLEDLPAQIVQLEHREDIRLLCHCLLEISRILVEVLLAARNDLRDEGEAIAGGTLREYGAVASLLYFIFEKSPLRDRRAGEHRSDVQFRYVSVCVYVFVLFLLVVIFSARSCSITLTP